MLESDNEDIINSFLDDLGKTKRKTRGQDRSKNYHKLTISITEADKLKVQEYAENHQISVSALIKKLLDENGVI